MAKSGQVIGPSITDDVEGMQLFYNKFSAAKHYLKWFFTVSLTALQPKNQRTR